MQKLLISLLLGLFLFCQSYSGHAYQSYADSHTDPEVNCSNCHNESVQWVPPSLSAPQLTYSVEGASASFNWSTVSGADGYMFYFAPLPFGGVSTIQSLNLGVLTGGTIELWEGAAFLVAIQAYNQSESSALSNVATVTVTTEPVNSTELTTLLSGRTLYTTISGRQGTLESWVFNAGATSFTYHELVDDDGEYSSNTIGITAGDMVLHLDDPEDGNIDITIVEITSNYIEISGDGVSQNRLYFDRTEAEAYFQVGAPTAAASASGGGC